MANLRGTNPFPRPALLKGIATKNAFRGLTGSFLLSVLVTTWYKESWLEKNKAFYKEYYDNYDAEKDFEFIKSQGVFTGYEAD